jgi:hypothetical protein
VVQGAVCKTAYTGSIPVVASTILSTKTPLRAYWREGVVVPDSERGWLAALGWPEHLHIAIEELADEVSVQLPPAPAH